MAFGAQRLCGVSHRGHRRISLEPCPDFGRVDVGSVVWTVVAPVIGRLLDRHGPRPLHTGGALLMAASVIVSGLAHTVLEFYLGMGILVGAGFAALSMASQATFPSHWVMRKRGMAIGLAASGIGLGILVVVLVTQWMIANFGWRQALLILAGLLIGVIALANFFLQRQCPEQKGLKPDFGAYAGSVPRRRDHGGGAGNFVKETVDLGGLSLVR